MSGVGGAVRNSSGHWNIGCRQVSIRNVSVLLKLLTLCQAEISYYRLELRPGYGHQYNDCMVCDHTGGPLILRRDSLLPDSPRSLATLDTALTTRRPMLACPDMMFLTRYSVVCFIPSLQF